MTLELMGMGGPRGLSLGQRLVVLVAVLLVAVAAVVILVAPSPALWRTVTVEGPPYRMERQCHFVLLPTAPPAPLACTTSPEGDYILPEYAEYCQRLEESSRPRQRCRNVRVPTKHKQPRPNLDTHHRIAYGLLGMAVVGGGLGGFLFRRSDEDA